MNGTLREDGHLESVEVVVDGASTILVDRLRHKPSLDDEVQLCRSRVHVWRVESARTKEANSHGTPRTNKGGESGVVSPYDGTAFTGDHTSGGGIPKVEDELFIVGEKLGAFDRVRSEKKLLEEGQARGVGRSRVVGWLRTRSVGVAIGGVGVCWCCDRGASQEESRSEE